MRPTKLVMVDAINQGEESTLEYSDMKLRELPDRVFTKIISSGSNKEDRANGRGPAVP